MSQAEITEAVQDPLEEFALGHIHENHYVAREVQGIDEYNDPLTFGMAYWENLHRRFLEDLVLRPATPFVKLKISQGYAVPAIDHDELGMIGLHHHRVKPPEYVPDGNSAGALKDRATRQRDLFDNASPQISHRLVGIVGNPFGDLEEVVVGKLEPIYPNSYRLVHKRKLDLKGGPGFNHGDQGGEPEIGPEPEPDFEPTVTRKKTEESV